MITRKLRCPPRCTPSLIIRAFFYFCENLDTPHSFTLLEKIYNAFDSIAKRQRVFKVETVGDSYVAVTGLPERQVNHAVIMARFAGNCLVRLGDVLKELEVSLGPDTTDLGMRFGVSGIC